MEKLVVKFAGKNDHGFGTVTLEDHLKDNGKHIIYSTGEKSKPPCFGGDTITATLGKNDKGYPTITNIKKVEGASKPKTGATQTPKYGNRDPEQQDMIMRQSAVKAAIDNRTKPAQLSDIVDDAEVFFKYYKTGDVPLPTDGQDIIDDEDIPF